MSAFETLACDPQVLSESEDELLMLKTQDRISSSCDVSPIMPHKLREAENSKTGVDMEKLLLERVMLRKELKLRHIQEKLMKQNEKLRLAEEKVLEYEKMQGMLLFKYTRRLLSLCVDWWTAVQLVSRWCVVQVCLYNCPEKY